MHGCLDNGSLATSSYLRNANIKTYVEECTSAVLVMVMGDEQGMVRVRVRKYILAILHTRTRTVRE